MRYINNYVLRTLIVIGSSVFLVHGLALTARATPPNPVKVGMPKTFFRDANPAIVRLVTIPFNSLMRAQTGMNGRLMLIDDPMVLAKQLNDKEKHLAVFHGFEFAWAQEKYPALRPLMIAINMDRELSACLITRNDKNLSDFASAKGKTVSVPRQSRGHCHLFLERKCEELGCQPDSFFSKVIRHPDIETALDAVVLGDVECLVVDEVALKCYREIKPGCFNRLKVVHKSPIFPAAVIAYREGSLSKSTLNRFKTGMIRAKQNIRARNLMMMMKLTGFEAIPNNFTNLVSSIRREYPSPDAVLQTASDVKETKKVMMEE